VRITIVTLPHTDAAEQIDLDVDEDTPVLEVLVDGESVYSIDLRTTSDADDGGDQASVVAHEYNDHTGKWVEIGEVEV
jgi:hypothetical protein